MADDNLDQRLARIEAALLTLPTKTDLDQLRTELRTEMSGFAKGADIRLLQTRVEQEIAETKTMRTETQAMRADVRLLTGMVTSMLGAVQALADHQIRLSDRVTALETPPPAP
jgi:hypothetical protein